MTKKKNKYQPNEIFRIDRIAFVLMAIFLLPYGVIGLIYGKIVIPSNIENQYAFLESYPAYAASIAMILGAISFILKVIDHYDRRENENAYRLIIKWIQFSALVFVGLSFIFMILQF